MNLPDFPDLTQILGPSSPDVLAFNDRPVAFLATDLFGTEHLFLFTALALGQETWIAAPVTPSDAVLIREGRVPWSVALGRCPGPVHVYTFTGGQEAPIHYTCAHHHVPAAWWPTDDWADLEPACA